MKSPGMRRKRPFTAVRITIFRPYCAGSLATSAYTTYTISVAEFRFIGCPWPFVITPNLRRLADSHWVRAFHACAWCSGMKRQAGSSLFANWELGMARTVSGESVGGTLCGMASSRRAPGGNIVALQPFPTGLGSGPQAKATPTRRGETGRAKSPTASNGCCGRRSWHPIRTTPSPGCSESASTTIRSTPVLFFLSGTREMAVALCPFFHRSQSSAFLRCREPNP
jgi:hypothetical protein